MSGKKLGIYVHIPFCKSKCGYCAFVSTPNLSLQKAYLATLVKEICSFKADGTVCDTVYIGGGTPSCLYDGALTEIFDALRKTFSVESNAEITVECNPESVSASFVSECKNAGVNRISMGLQSSDDAILKKIGRIHDFNGYLTALEALHKEFDNISTDLILGLPGQTKKDLDKAFELALPHCAHASVYALSVEEGTPLFKSGYAPDDDAIADMYEYACAALFDMGFSRYEVSNFARTGRESKHNLKYWRNMPYVGFGVAAHGYDGKGVRYAHGDDILEYIKEQAPKRIALSEKDRYNEYIMLALRTERGMDLRDFEKTFGYAFLSKFGNIAHRLESDGYLRIDKDFLRIDKRYIFVMNGIIEEFMEY